MAKKIKVVFFCGSNDGTPEDGANLIAGLVRKFKDSDDAVIEPVLVTYFKEQLLLMQKRGLKCVYIPAEKERFPVRNLPLELRELEIKYDFCAERILLGDVNYSTISRKKAFTDLVKLFRFWGNFIDLEKPDFIFGGDNGFGNLVPYFVCHYKKVRYEVIYPIPIAPHTNKMSAKKSKFYSSFMISEHKDGFYSELDWYWQNNHNRKLNPDEKEAVERYVNDFRQEKSKAMSFDTRPKITLAKLRYAIDRIIAYMFVEKKDTPFLNPWRGIKKYLMMMIRAKLCKVYYEEPKENEKFVFLPLHFDLETILLISNHQYQFQERLAEQISHNLPAGYKLYVKGHPAYLGGHRLSLYRSLRKLPNVRIINPLVGSRSLIKKASAVAVIAGTAGWEALVLKKPVISFGMNYYDISGLTFKVPDFFSTDRVISSAVQSDSSKFDEEMLFRFINAYFKSAHKGRFCFTALYYSNASNRDQVLNEENLSDLADSLVKHVQKVMAH